MPTLRTERARRFACRRDIASLGASNENRARPIDVVSRSNGITRDRSHLILVCAERTHGARSLPNLILVLANGTVADNGAAGPDNKFASDSNGTRRAPSRRRVRSLGAVLAG